MIEPIIRLSQVLKRYRGEAPVLNGIDLRIEKGEFVSLMGPSGSGKTTLLNLVSGLDRPDGGRVMLDGRDLGDLPDRQLADLRLRTIGFVFQGFNLLPALTVERNVAWPLQFAGCSACEARERATAALLRVRITNQGGRYPSELSGGEQQRVAIARAIATRPSILLADEPTGNLDSRTGQNILDLLRALNLADGVTIMMVTHNALAAAYGDRTLEIHDGRIIRDVRVPSEQHKVAALVGTGR